MEVVKENVAMLSNFEVYSLLKESQEKTKKQKSNGRSQNLATITYETSEFLSKTPCAIQNSEVIEDFMKKMTSYKLTRAEKLQLLNLRPTTDVELQLVIEDLFGERFAGNEIAELLELIQTLLPDLPQNED